MASDIAAAAATAATSSNSNGGNSNNINNNNNNNNGRDSAPVVDMSDVETDPAQAEYKRFVDDYFQRRATLWKQMAALLDSHGKQYDDDDDKTLVANMGEALLMLGFFVVEHFGIGTAAELLLSRRDAYFMPYIIVLEYAIDEYDDMLDPPEAQGRLTKRCAILQTREWLQNFELGLYNSKRRFAINRCWMASVRRWSLYVVNGPGSFVSWNKPTALIHLDPDLCAPHHWVDTYDQLDFDDICKALGDNSVVEQRDIAVHAMLGIVRVNKLRDYLASVEQDQDQDQEQESEQRCESSSPKSAFSPVSSPSSATATTLFTCSGSSCGGSGNTERRKRIYAQTSLSLSSSPSSTLSSTPLSSPPSSPNTSLPRWRRQCTSIAIIDMA